MLNLLAMSLAHGSHGTEFCGEACIIEIANLIAAGRVVVPAGWMPPCPLQPVAFSDDHPSISRVIRAYTTGLNDAWTARPGAASPEILARLRDYAPRILCTATGAEDEGTRAWMATDWLVRVHTPAFLRLAGLEEHARALESLARIADAVTARSAQSTLAAARDAALAAARAAARDAAGAAALAAAGNAAWDAAGDAARDAAGDAAGDAAWDAAGAAALAAVGNALRPTVEALQVSALDLLDAMIQVGK